MLSAINKELFCVSVPSRYQILKHGGFWLNCGFPPSLIFFFSSLSLGSSSFSSPHLVFWSSSWSHHSGTPGLQNVFNLNFKPLGLWQFFSNLNINFCGSSWPVEGTMGSRRASSQHDVSWELHFFFHQLMLGSHVGKLFVLQRKAASKDPSTMESIFHMHHHLRTSRMESNMVWLFKWTVLPILLPSVFFPFFFYPAMRRNDCASEGC